MKKSKILQRVFWIILLALGWQLIFWSGRFSPLVFPSLLEIGQVLIESLINGELSRQLLFSLSIIVQALFISLLLALFLSLTAHFSENIAGLIDTLVALAHPLPGIALMPLVLIWSGAGRQAILVIIVHSVLWPMVLNLRTGFSSIPEIYRLVGQNYGLSRLQILSQIMVPAALPYFLAGLKIGWARAWRALISAEMLFGAVNSVGGLGWYIFQKRVFFDLPGVFAGITVIVIIGILVEDFIFDKIENKTVQKWGMES
ncbi:MAG: ABC transporter permease subunit [Firmicutes bacterium]|nr:ABC transporter permease subunit [Bacillota bacterium]